MTFREWVQTPYIFLDLDHTLVKVVDQGMSAFGNKFSAGVHRKAADAIVNGRPVTVLPRPGLEQFLSAAESLGSLNILSGAKRDDILSVLEALDIKNRFHGVFSTEGISLPTKVYKLHHWVMADDNLSWEKMKMLGVPIDIDRRAEKYEDMTSLIEPHFIKVLPFAGGADAELQRVLGEIHKKLDAQASL